MRVLENIFRSGRRACLVLYCRHDRKEGAQTEEQATNLVGPFDGIDAKLGRALAHFDNLFRVTKAFADREPYSVRIHRDGDVLRFFAVDNKIGPPPSDIVLIAGEAVYQLRSSLDHLIHQLVIANGNAALLKESRTHQFPIFETPDGYEARAGRRIVGVSDLARRLLQAVQPHHLEAGSVRRHPLGCSKT